MPCTVPIVILPIKLPINTISSYPTTNFDAPVCLRLHFASAARSYTTLTFNVSRFSFGILSGATRGSARVH